MFNLTIKSRLIGAMGFMAIMLVIGAFMGIYGVSNSNAVIQEIFTNQLPSVENLGQSRVLLLRSRTAIDRVIAHPDAPDAAETIKRSEDFLAKSDELWKKYLALPQDVDEKKISDIVAVARDKYIKDAHSLMVAAIKSGNKDEADRINMSVVPPLFSSYSDKMSELSDYQFKSASLALNKSNDEFKTFVWIDIFGIVAGLSAVFASAFFLLRAISNPLKAVLHQFESIGNGDLTNQIRPKSNDEMGKLLAGLENMRQSLVQTVTVVRQGSSSIAISSDEIATGNMDLSSRTEQQAASLEETASSMEELTSTVQQNADNARQANTLAVAASEVATRGGQVVGDVVHTMSSIKESSKKIVDIIAVIDGIAFQTNILALNAAVEAARAGEQGRGFAVVASEVRNLAQRSASAAKEIKTLIGDSVDKVEVGTRLVDDAGKTMDEIVTSIQSVADIMAEITAASAEQSDGISQVNQAITKMDEATQQNAALVEQAAAAAGSMQDQARQLNQAVSIFKVTASDTGSHAGNKAPAMQAISSPKPASKTIKKTGAKPAVKSISNKPASTSSSATSAASAKKATGGASEDDWEEF
ncbi:methyl-accepting chemotaxis protein [Undibacterium sp. RuTC16W]|uniref:methyl-accepting chemotaxis protein n=1 Tax=Undibacterium sp. RuTC16W TaxID=3413048 RepID=UPI003BF16AC4